MRPNNTVMPLLKRATDSVIILFAGIALHIVFGVAMKGSAILSTLHALTVLSAGAVVGFSGKRPVVISMVVAYIAGSETLWRMTRADIYWEFGKYAVVVVLAIAMVYRYRPLRSTLSGTYFLLLVPATIVTLLSERWEITREMVSFNLSGPLSLMFCSLFFAGRAFTVMEIRAILLAYVLPTMSMSTVILLNISSRVITFSGNSNFAASGGFGPNQVSTALGFGVVAAFLLLMLNPAGLRRKLIPALLLSLFAVQSVLTFSRAGLYYSVTAIGLSGAMLVQDRRYRVAVLMLVVALTTLSYFFVLPRLDEFTGGALAKRYSDQELTGRDEIMKADLQIFSRYAALGIGVGKAVAAREEIYSASTLAHTEYTRLLSEHGMLGAIAGVLMVTLALRGMMTAGTPAAKGIIVCFASYGLLFMMGNGMRLVLPSLCVGLAQLVVREAENAPGTVSRNQKL